MKITKVEVLQVKTAGPNWRPVFCRIHTDAGIYGDGEVGLTHGRGALAGFGMLRDLAPMIIGMDPMNIEAIWEKLYKDTFWGQNGGAVIFSAISGIDMALWDLKGKALGVPVYQLLGGKFRDKIRCYASQLQNGWFPEDYKSLQTRNCYTIEDYRRAAEFAMEEGYDAVKLDLLAWSPDGGRYSRDERERFLSPKLVRDVEERMAVTREVVGDDVEIIIENHARIDSPGAIQVANAIEKYNIMYFEEPATTAPHILRELKHKIRIPIASGERIYTRWQYIPYFEDASLAVVQPDMGNCGGFTETKKVCDMAHAYDVGVQLHICCSPLSTSAALHLEAAIPNFVIHEHHTFNRCLASEGLALFNPQPVNGYFGVPEAPGIGNEIAPEAFKNAFAYCVVE